MMTLNLAGNILRILEGEIEASDIQEIDLSLFDFALGSGTYFGPLGIGETMIIGGKPYVSFVEEGKLKTHSGKNFKTPFLIGISKDESPTYILENQSPISLQELYEKQALQDKLGFAILGIGNFLEFHATYLKKAPIYHENVNLNSASYWEKEDVKKNQGALFFGVIIGPEGQKKFSSELLGKAFYQNPMEMGTSPIMSHTHAAILKSIPEKIPPYNQLPVQEIRHFLTHSILDQGTLNIYPFSKIVSSVSYSMQ